MRLGARRVTFPLAAGPRPSSVILIDWCGRACLAGALALLMTTAVMFGPACCRPAVGCAVALQFVVFFPSAVAALGTGCGLLVWLMELAWPRSRAAALTWRRPAVRGLLLAAVAMVLTLTGYGCLTSAALHRAVFNGEPIVDAVRRYLSDHHALPQALADLVPVYLPRIPSTGVALGPSFRYGVDGRVADWTLPMREGEWYVATNWTAECIAYDVVFYWPSEDYPESWGEGPVIRIGRWAHGVVWH